MTIYARGIFQRTTSDITIGGRSVSGAKTKQPHLYQMLQKLRQGRHVTLYRDDEGMLRVEEVDEVICSKQASQLALAKRWTGPVPPQPDGTGHQKCVLKFVRDTGRCGPWRRAWREMETWEWCYDWEVGDAMKGGKTRYVSPSSFAPPQVREPAPTPIFGRCLRITET